jgi:hypothetical protein
MWASSSLVGHRSYWALAWVDICGIIKEQAPRIHESLVLQWLTKDCIKILMVTL